LNTQTLCYLFEVGLSNRSSECSLFNKKVFSASGQKRSLSFILVNIFLLGTDSLDSFIFVCDILTIYINDEIYEKVDVFGQMITEFSGSN